MLAQRLLASGVAKRPRSSLFFTRLSAIRSVSARSNGSSDVSAAASPSSTPDKQDQQPKKRQETHDVELLVDALRHYHQRHQHFVVPYSFAVPSGDGPDDREGWPEHLRGVRLGRAMKKFVKELNTSNNKRSTDRHVDVQQQLKAMGFPVVADWKQFQWEQVTLSALRTFKATEGHLRVPRKFVVPENDERWGRPAWGYRLGAHVNQLRVKRESLEAYQVGALEELGFAWNTSDDKWGNLFLPALRKFHELHGHVNVPQMFTVPHDDSQWPHELWGFGLGRMVNQIRSGDLYYPQVERYLPELNVLGFSFSSIESTWDEKILPSLQVFQSVYGHCNVGKYFEVPHEVPWPEKAWGMKLGFIVHNIRGRGDFFQLVGRDMERLEQLGFVWNISEAKWRQRILPSLKAFVHVHGHATIPRNFIVPSKAPWPTKAWGMDLGRIASDSSYQGRYADYIEIERNQLEALGFFWSVTTRGVEEEDHDTIE